MATKGEMDTERKPDKVEWGSNEEMENARVLDICQLYRLHHLSTFPLQVSC